MPSLSLTGENVASRDARAREPADSLSARARKARAVRPVARAVVAVASGLALAAAFPPYDVYWLMPLGLAGLMAVMPGRRGRAGFGYGLLFGMAFMLPLLRWITIIGADAWVALSFAEALFYGLMGMSWAWLRRYAWWPVAYGASWVGAEFLRGTVPFGGLPWGRLAFGLVGTPVIRYGRVGGTALVSLLVVLAVGLVVAACTRRRPRTIAALVGGALVIGLVSAVLPVGATHVDSSVTVAAIQGNVPGQGMDPFAERRAVLNNHAATTHAFARRVAAGDAPRPDIVIWPENSTDIDPFSDESAYREIDDAVKAIGVPTLVGAVVAGPDPQHVENMGIVWSPTTGPGERYIKRHPVPFGEYIPFRSVLTKYIKRLKQIPRDFASGSKPGDLQLGPARIGDVICFEVAYDGLVRDVINGGGQLLVVQTNNATYTGTGQLEQQLAISRYRAVETGRAVVVAATNGISAIVAPNGVVEASSPQKTRAVLEEQVPLVSGVTWGVRDGFWVDLLLSLLALVLTVVAGVRSMSHAGSRLGRRREVDRIRA